MSSTNFYIFSPGELSNNLVGLNIPNDIKCHIDGPWLAGGYWRSQIDKTITKDRDYFFESEGQFAATLNFIKDYLKLPILCDTENSITFQSDKTIIQLIRKKYFKNITTLLNCFDYTCCMFAWDGSYLHTNYRIIADCQDKVLYLNNDDQVMKFSIERYRKFIRLGYRSPLMRHSSDNTEYELLEKLMKDETICKPSKETYDEI